MATFDLTTKGTLGVSSNVIEQLPSKFTAHNSYLIERHLDIAKLIASGVTIGNGDVFQLLKIPAKSLVIAAGAEVVTAFDGTTPTVDIDFAGGDDIVDGGDVTSVGFLAAGANGQGIVIGGAPTFTQLVSSTDTIDVTLTAASSDVTEGVLRVFAFVLDLDIAGGQIPTEVTRDQL